MIIILLYYNVGAVCKLCIYDDIVTCIGKQTFEQDNGCTRNNSDELNKNSCM